MSRRVSARPFLVTLGISGLICSVCGALTLLGNVSGIAGNTRHFVPVVEPPPMAGQAFSGDDRANLGGLMISTALFAMLAMVPTFFEPAAKKPTATPAQPETH